MITAWWEAYLQALIAPATIMLDLFGMVPPVPIPVDLRPRLDQPCQVIDLRSRRRVA